MSYFCKSPASDFQQCESYKWEDSLTKWAGAKETDLELKAAMIKACKMYRVPPPTLFLLSKDRDNQGKYMSSNYDPITHTIRLRPRHRNLAVILHETAHAIVDWVVGPFSKAGHGKLWLGVYIELMARFKIMPKHVLVYSAKHDGLMWDKQASPNKIRRSRPKMVKEARKWRRILKIFE